MMSDFPKTPSTLAWKKIDYIMRKSSATAYRSRDEMATIIVSNDFKGGCKVSVICNLASVKHCSANDRGSL